MTAVISGTRKSPLRQQSSSDSCLDLAELGLPRSYAQERQNVIFPEPVTLVSLTQGKTVSARQRLTRWAELEQLLPQLNPVQTAEIERYGLKEAIDEMQGFLRQEKPRSLTLKQEQILFRGYNAALHQASLLIKKLLENDQILPSGNSIDDARRVLFIARDAKAALAEHNMPLVLTMAFPRRKSRTPAQVDDEFLSEGYMALAHSIDKFDWTRGYKFSTYACNGIAKAFCRVAKRRGTYASRYPQLEEEWAGGDSRTLEAAEILVQAETLLLLKKFLPLLKDVKQIVIRERFGLGGEPPKTLQEIASIVGVTKERVRQIQNIALDDLRFLFEMAE